MSKVDWSRMLTGTSALYMIAALASSAQTFKVLAQFNGTNGLFPEASLVQGTDGNFYGTTTDGGGYGTVFKVTSTGAVKALHSFRYADGAYPAAGLTLGSDGNFYGATSAGADNSCDMGCGTIFRITPGGVFSTLHSFSSSDGANPTAPPIQATDGNFYGTTAYGGGDDTCTVGCGTVFRMSVAGALTTLHSFNSHDGANPFAALFQGTDRNFYGTTLAGGANGFCNFEGLSGCGTVFKISPAGALTTLHSFDGNDGANPFAALIEAADGNFYGTTFDGALYGGGFCAGGAARGTCGVIFKITSAGAFGTLHRFSGIEGGSPEAGLIQATDGNLYGATVYGGEAEYFGTIFRISTGGALVTLWSFSGNTDGANPYGGLFQSTAGNLYGTTTSYGAYQDGTIFTESIGLGPFVMSVPTARKIGQSVIILGTNLTGATSVTFNGTAATFKVVSATEITTTVPTGATTGTLQVVTPGGTLESNVPFRVLP